MSKRLSFFLIIIFLLVGCTPKNRLAAGITETVGAGIVTVTMKPDDSPTPMPSATRTNTATLTATATITPSPTFSTDFSQAKIAGLSYQAGWKTFYIGLDVGTEIDGEYTVAIEGNRYLCQVYEDSPQRLTCNGPTVSLERWLELEVFEESTGRVVYRTDFMVPLSAVIPDEWMDDEDE